MRVYICADIEGVAGVSSREQLRPEGGVEYQRARETFTLEVAAACEGALEAGATEIVVSDSHGLANNIQIEKLPRQARLVRAWPRPLDGEALHPAGPFGDEDVAALDLFGRQLDDLGIGQEVLAGVLPDQRGPQLQVLEHALFGQARGADEEVVHAAASTAGAAKARARRVHFAKRRREPFESERALAPLKGAIRCARIRTSSTGPPSSPWRAYLRAWP